MSSSDVTWVSVGWRLQVLKWMKCVRTSVAPHLCCRVEVGGFSDKFLQLQRLFLCVSCLCVQVWPSKRIKLLEDLTGNPAEVTCLNNISGQSQNLKIDWVSPFKVNQLEVWLRLCLGNRPAMFLMRFRLHFNFIWSCSCIYHDHSALLVLKKWTRVQNTVNFLMLQLRFSLLSLWNLKYFMFLAFRLTGTTCSVLCVCFQSVDGW